QYEIYYLLTTRSPARATTRNEYDESVRVQTHFRGTALHSRRTALLSRQRESCWDCSPEPSQISRVLQQCHLAPLALLKILEIPRGFLQECQGRQQCRRFFTIAISPSASDVQTIPMLSASRSAPLST